uniref:DJ-1/PfpI domain-containing protein n=1 Tax=Glossina palpalis gambiensis TaxID=67801 RepID=A0A1B0BL29_9MUSC
MEVVISADVLRRSDIDVTIAGLCGKEPIKCNNNLVIIPDAGLEDVKKEKFDAIILPGGWDNVQTMARSEEFGEFLREKETESYIATFCHGPIALAKHCIGKGKFFNLQVTCYRYVDEKIVVDGNLITCEGPAAAFLFALKIVELLRNTKKAQEVADILLVDDYKEGRRNFGSFLKKPSIHEKKALNGKEPKSAVIIFANGAEEMEVVIPADVLRRAKVVDVILAGLCDNKPVKCNQGLVIVPDCAMKDLENRKFDAIVLPGGLENNLAMAESDKFGEYLKKKEEESYIAAICSGPLALAAHCIGKGKRVTSYPKVKPDLESIYKYVDDEKVVVDGKLVTSQGPGTAFLFALKLVELLKDKQEAKEIAKLLLVDNYC